MTTHRIPRSIYALAVAALVLVGLVIGGAIRADGQDNTPQPEEMTSQAVQDNRAYRLGGADRYETAALVALVYWRPDLRQAQYVYLANGQAPYDALGAGASVADRGPVLLVPTGDTLPPIVTQALSILQPYQGVIALGGPGAVSDAQLEAAAIAAGFGTEGSTP